MRSKAESRSESSYHSIVWRILMCFSPFGKWSGYDVDSAIIDNDHHPSQRLWNACYLRLIIYFLFRNLHLGIIWWCDPCNRRSWYRLYACLKKSTNWLLCEMTENWCEWSENQVPVYGLSINCNTSRPMCQQHVTSGRESLLCYSTYIFTESKSVFANIKNQSKSIFRTQKYNTIFKKEVYVF